MQIGWEIEILKLFVQILVFFRIFVPLEGVGGYASYEPGSNAGHRFENINPSERRGTIEA